VVYGQETFGKVAGGFTPEEFTGVVEDLIAVERMHSDSFATVVPKLVRRQTYTEFDKEYQASPEVLNRCHNSRHRIFFGVQNDFSACWLATLDSSFREQSYVGSLRDDATMETIRKIVDGGVGAGLGRGAKLSCNSCVASNYNSMVDRILEHLSGEESWESELVQHEPGAVHDEDYELILGGASHGEVLAARPDGASAPRRLLPLLPR
jgi:hypothetical protein